MSLNAAALRLMRDKGLSFDDVVEIAAAMEARRDTTGAERQQRYRDRHKVTRDVTRDGSPNDNTLTPSDSPTEASLLPVKRDKPNPFPCPAFADPQHWHDLLVNRKRKRQPNTSTAYADMMADIARIADDEWPPGRLVQHAAAKGWGGIYDPRAREKANGHHRPEQSLRGSRPDPAIDLLRQAQAERAAEGADENQGADSGTGIALPSYLTGRS